GATTLSIADTRDTDHVSFDAVGLPAFQFIQDPLDYETRTHHTDMDVYDHAQPRDLMQASAILASFVYDAATRPEPLPRKPLPASCTPAPTPAPGAGPAQAAAAALGARRRPGRRGVGSGGRGPGPEMSRGGPPIRRLHVGMADPGAYDEPARRFLGDGTWLH